MRKLRANSELIQDRGRAGEKPEITHLKISDDDARPGEASSDGYEREPTAKRRGLELVRC